MLKLSFAIFLSFLCAVQNAFADQKVTSVDNVITCSDASSKKLCRFAIAKELFSGAEDKKGNLKITYRGTVVYPGGKRKSFSTNKPSFSFTPARQVTSFTISLQAKAKNRKFTAIVSSIEHFPKAKTPSLPESPIPDQNDDDGVKKRLFSGSMSNSGPVSENSAATVTITATGGSGSYSYKYDFNNDTVFELVTTANTATIPAIYLTDGPGARTVHGLITDSAGSSLDVYTTISIVNVSPTASIRGSYSGKVGDGTALQADVSDPSPSDTSSGFTYLWSFGDGSSSSLANPVHSYSTDGNYTVSLTVKDKDGGTATASSTATIAALVNSGQNHEPFIQTPYNQIPNFGRSPNISSRRSGNWSDPTIWSLNRIPVAGDIVSIDSGTNVIYDIISSAAINTVVVQSSGHFVFKTDTTTKLVLTNLLILEGAELQIGTASTPILANAKAEIVIANTPIDMASDPESYGHGIIGLGKVTIHGAPKPQTFVRLANEPRAGQSTLSLAQSIAGWQPGDKLILSDTRQMTPELYGSPPQREFPVIASASSNTINLTSALQFDHKGAYDGNDHLRLLPHVANLTRNVSIRSENPQGTRGHVLFANRADVDIRYAAFGGLGRTTSQVPDSTTFDSAHNVTRLGTNQDGRFPIHFDHVFGPTETPANGYQFTFVGNTVTCPLDPMPFRWGITIHASHDGLIKDNVVHNWAGAGIIADTGNESFNVIDHNFVTRISGGGRADSQFFNGNVAVEGSGLWFKGPLNTVQNNVVTESSWGYTYFQVYTGNVQVPSVQGKDPAINGVTVNANATALLSFENNEAYNVVVGFTDWWLGSWSNIEISGVAESLVKDFTVWNFSTDGVYGYQSSNVTIDHLVAIGDKSVLGNPLNGATGVSWRDDYMVNNGKIVNSYIANQRTGILCSPFTKGTFYVNNSYLQNATNIIVQTQGAPGAAPDGHEMPPAHFVFSNDLFVPLSGSIGGVSPYDIVMAYSQWRGSANLIQTISVDIQNWNRTVGNNFRVFFNEQAPGFVVPQSSGYLVGSPVSGLTNQQNWQQYGIAIAGAVAPASATTRPRIYGLVQ